MRTAKFLIPFILVLFVRCEKEYRVMTSQLTDGFCIQINDDHIINRYDIEYYDYSTHIVYLKSSDTIFNKPFQTISFKVYANFEEIYHGNTQSLISCSMVIGPTINFFYPAFVISIGNVYFYDSTGAVPPDPREDERIIAALTRYNQFHSGLRCSIDTVIPAPTGLILRISVINNDSFNYYILSPDNMGMALFHYFTNGLRISDDIFHESYGHHIETLQPEPFDSWNNEWFYLIRRNEIKSFILYYSQFDVIPKGQYDAYFRFPGMKYQVKNKEDIEGENGRIWLGEIDAKKKVTIK